MATWPEARAAKTERLRRETRHFTPDMRGLPCPVCKGPTSAKLQAATGVLAHPCCSAPACMPNGYAPTIRVSS